MEANHNLKAVYQYALNNKFVLYHKGIQIKGNKFNDCYMKIDPPKWISADFKCINKPVDEPQRKKMFVNKQIVVSYNIVKKSLL